MEGEKVAPFLVKSMRPNVGDAAKGEISFKKDVELVVLERSKDGDMFKGELVASGEVGAQRLQTLCERVEAELDGRAKDGSPAHPKKARKAAKIEKAAQSAESAPIEKPKRKGKTKN